jgi:hypothetical protein
MELWPSFSPLDKGVDTKARFNYIMQRILFYMRFMNWVWWLHDDSNWMSKYVSLVLLETRGLKCVV